MKKIFTLLLAIMPIVAVAQDAVGHYDKNTDVVISEDELWTGANRNVYIQIQNCNVTLKQGVTVTMQNAFIQRLDNNVFEIHGTFTGVISSYSSITGNTFKIYQSDGGKWDVTCTKAAEDMGEWNIINPTGIGQVRACHDGTFYDINGRIVKDINKAPRGVYFMNGAKFTVL